MGDVASGQTFATKVRENTFMLYWRTGGPAGVQVMLGEQQARTIPGDMTPGQSFTTNVGEQPFM